MVALYTCHSRIKHLRLSLLSCVRAMPSAGTCLQLDISNMCIQPSLKTETLFSVFRLFLVGFIPFGIENGVKKMMESGE